MPWSRERFGRARGAGAERRILCESRNRHSDPGGQLHSAGHEGGAAVARTACWASAPFLIEGEEDPDLINAGKQTVTALPMTRLFLPPTASP